MIVIRLIAKAFGVLVMAFAFVQWLSFDYPDLNPLQAASILSPGMISQTLNWFIVCVLGAIGGLLYSLGKSSGKEIGGNGGDSAS